MSLLEFFHDYVCMEVFIFIFNSFYHVFLLIKELSNLKEKPVALFLFFFIFYTMSYFLIYKCLVFFSSPEGSNLLPYGGFFAFSVSKGVWGETKNYYFNTMFFVLFLYYDFFMNCVMYFINGLFCMIIVMVALNFYFSYINSKLNEL